MFSGVWGPCGGGFGTCRKKRKYGSIRGGAEHTNDEHVRPPHTDRNACRIANGRQNQTKTGKTLNATRRNGTESGLWRRRDASAETRVAMLSARENGELCFTKRESATRERDIGLSLVICERQKKLDNYRPYGSYKFSRVECLQ